jgi:thiamine pyrophosphokinase
MSSHHIVREDQEPALLILNPHAISFEKVQELLEWMPTVIVLADQVETIAGWGIKVDVVLIPFAEAEVWKNKLSDQAPVKFLTYNPGDDPLVTAFQFLTTSKASAVNCLLGGLDELKKIEFFTGLDVEVFTDKRLWRWMKNGRFEKWVPAGAKLNLLPEHVRAEHHEFACGYFEVAKDGIVVVKSKQSFWIGEEVG